MSLGELAVAYQLACCSYLLPRHPRVLKRLRDEIRSVAGDNKDLKREDIKKMPYLAIVLKESNPHVNTVP